MATESIVLRQIEDRDQRIRWDETSPLHLTIATRAGELNVRHGVFTGGVSEGVEIVRLSNSLMAVDVLPTRGMSVWRITRGDARFGWTSPVVGPVHPMHVPVSEPSGLGWLSGFDELVVRCGLESNGAPVHDDAGTLRHPLHGHVGNTPADSLSIEYDEASGRVELSGEVIESRLFFKRLRLRCRIRLHADRDELELLDDVTNERDQDATMQLLYHINLGRPVLERNSTFQTVVSEVAPRDARAASGIDRWDRMDGPEVGFAEQVYYTQPVADAAGYAHALLASPDRTNAMNVSFKTSTLPFMSLWKNTAGDGDGYVVGIEPATGFPNQRTFEEEKGRLVSLAPGATQSFRVRLRPMVDPEAVSSVAAEIKSLHEESEPATVHPGPIGNWCQGAPDDDHG
ncbi:MAG: aldose 1-epimerase family protein [Planctomycetota bacterium]